MRIRDLSPDDLPRVLALEARCFSDPWSGGMFLSELRDPACRWYAAEADGLLVGYAGMQTVLDEGTLTNIAVDPAYRRQGAATALIQRLFWEAAALSLRFLTLEVRASNESAINLYTRLGFQPVGRRRGYYLQPPEDAILMTYFFTEDHTL